MGLKMDLDKVDLLALWASGKSIKIPGPWKGDYRQSFPGSKPYVGNYYYHTESDIIFAEWVNHNFAKESFSILRKFMDHPISDMWFSPAGQLRGTNNRRIWSDTDGILFHHGSGKGADHLFMANVSELNREVLIVKLKHLGLNFSQLIQPCTEFSKKYKSLSNIDKLVFEDDGSLPAFTFMFSEYMRPYKELVEIYDRK